jgi:predicted Zn-dependent protease
MQFEGCSPHRYAPAAEAFESGRILEARALLESCVAEAPDHLESRVLLGVCYARLGEPARAEGMLRSVTALDPVNIEGHLRLGALLAQQDRVGEAIREYRAVLAQDPDHAEARHRMAELSGVPADRRAEPPS